VGSAREAARRKRKLQVATFSPHAPAWLFRHGVVTVPARATGDDARMVVSSVRTDIRVVRFIRRCEPRSGSIAAVVRATGTFCEKSGLTRPSYEQIRLLVHEARDRRERRRAALDLVLDVDLRRRPPSDLLYLLDDPRRAPLPRSPARSPRR
jgi:hypothetical protein